MNLTWFDPLTNERHKLPIEDNYKIERNDKEDGKEETREVDLQEKLPKL